MQACRTFHTERPFAGEFEVEKSVTYHPAAPTKEVKGWQSNNDCESDMVDCVHCNASRVIKAARLNSEKQHCMQVQILTVASLNRSYLYCRSV
jgi:hypothetical protein